jgi:hypothetical protein
MQPANATLLNPEATQSPGGGGYINSGASGYSSPLPADVSGFAKKTLTINTTAPLTGGGDLSTDRTFAITFGTTAATACIGNDSRLSDARTPTAHNQALTTITTSIIAGTILKSDGSNPVASSITETLFNAKAPLVSPSFTTPALGVASATSITFGGAVLSNYTETTWAPSFTGLTVVGTPTYTANCTRVGRLVLFSIRIQSTTSTASAGGGGSYFGLPVVPAANSTMQAVTSGVSSLPNGYILGGNGFGFLPAWTANADVTVSGFYFA